MKKLVLRTLFPIVIVFCFSALYAGDLNYQEKADILFMDLSGHISQYINKHSAIYVGYDLKHEGKDPANRKNHILIEQAGRPGIQYNTLKDFENAIGDYHGSFKKVPLTKEQREDIIKVAERLRTRKNPDKTTGVPYVSTDPNPAGFALETASYFIKWKDYNGDDKLDENEIIALRCDAFVEYCYAKGAEIQIGNDIINNTNWYNLPNIGDGTDSESGYKEVGKITNYRPSVQMSLLINPDIDDPKPAHDFDSPSHNNAIGQWNDPQSKNPKIEVEWQSGADDDNYSGLHSYFIEWSQNRHIKITYYVQAEIVKAEDGAAVYKANSAKSRWPITDGKWWLHTRTVDQAGNWDEGHDGGASTAHYGPFFIDTTPPNISISGVSDGGTYSDPVTVQYVVTDKYLEPSSVSPNWGGNTQAVDPDRIPDTGDEYVKITASRVFEAPGNHAVTISAKDKAGNSAAKTVRFTIQKTSDTPDDNESSSSPISEAVAPDPSAKIALLQRGFYSYTGELLNSLHEVFELVDTDFSDSIVEKYPILIIPTGGLFGMENSNFFKAKLQQYVERGGRLVCFSQQHGYEFSALPSPSTEEGPAVSGYGWQEDQSCYYNALYINKYHQILSGQPDSSITTSVDGYFTKCPQNSLTILNRVKNSMPALVMYDAGKGKVIATTSYLDWGYKNLQFAEDDKLLMRDIIGWLKEAKELPEYKPADMTNLDITVSNETTGSTAKKAIVCIKDPNGKNIATQEYATDILPGENTVLNIAHQLSDIAPWGIWQISYKLKDEEARVIQDEKIPAGFAVTALEVKDMSQGITLDIVSDSEYFAYGSDGVFVVNIGNNTDVEKTGTVKGNYGFKERQVVVPARGRISLEHLIENITNWGRFGITYYGDNGRNAVSAVRGFFVFNPSVTFGVRADKKMYQKGENANITVNMRNNNAYASNFTLNLIVTDPLGTKIWEKSSNIELKKQESLAQTFALPLENIHKPGIYIVKVDGGYGGGGKVGSAAAYFEVPSSLLSVTPDTSGLSDPEPKVKFNVKNTGLVDVDSAQIKVELLSPKNEIIHQDVKVFALCAGQAARVDFSLASSVLEFGRYILNYTLTCWSGRLCAGQEYIDNNYVIDVNFDKASYSVRGTLNAGVKITNSGSFRQPLTLITRANRFNAEQTETMTLDPAKSLEIKRSFSIPERTPPGTYVFEVSLKSGNSVLTKNFNFIIPEPSLQVGIDGNHFTSLDSEYLTGFIAGSPLEFWIKNAGGVDTAYICNLSLKDAHGVTVYPVRCLPSNGVNVNEFFGNASAGQKEARNFVIPADIAGRDYVLSIECKDVRTEKMSHFLSNIYIKGIKASLDVRADKDVYTIDEPINIGAEIDKLNGTGFKGDLSLELLLGEGRFEFIPAKDNVKLIKEDADGNLWTAYERIYGVGRYNLAEKEWKLYHQGNSILPVGGVNDIAIDQDNVWFASEAGLWRYEKTGDTWQVYQGERYELINNIWTKMPCNCGLMGNYIDKILLDEGKLWLITAGRSFGTESFEKSVIEEPVINVFDPSDDTWQYFKKEDINFIGDYIDWISSDETGIWIGTNGFQENEFVFGLSRYDKTTQLWETFTNDAVTLNIGCFAAGQNDIWMGMSYCWTGESGNDGVLCYSKVTNEWTRYTSQNSGLKSDDVLKIFLSGDDVWFIHHYNGISRFNKKTRTWQVYNGQNGKFPAGFYAIDTALMRENKLWIASFGRVYVYDILLNSWNSIDRAAGISGNYVKDLFGGRRAYITFSDTTDVNYVEPNAPAVYLISQPGIPYDKRRVFADGEDIWFASSAYAASPGVMRYNTNTGEYKEYNAKQSAVLGGDIVSIVFDGEEVWFYGYRGICKYSKAADTWVTYLSNEELGGNHINTMAVINNEVWCGGGIGLSIYDKLKDSWTFLDSISGVDLSNITKIVSSNGDTLLNLSYPSRILRRNSETGLWQAYDSGNSPIEDYEVISDLFKAGSNIWAAGRYGMYRYALDCDEWFVYNFGWYGGAIAAGFDNELWLASPVKMRQGWLDHDGEKYAGVYRTFTLSKYDRTEDKWVEYVKEDFINDSSYNPGGEVVNIVLEDRPLCVNEIHSIIPHKDSLIFIGSGGVSIYDRPSASWHNYPINLNFLGGSVCDNAVWLTANGFGVIRKFLYLDVWKRQVEVEVNDTLSVEHRINNLNIPGKFLLKGVLSLKNGQQIAEDYDSFYVAKDALILTLDTDKQIYKPDETVDVTGEIINRGKLPLTGVRLAVKKGDSAVFAGTVDLGEGDSYPFSFTLQSKETFKLQAEAGDSIISQAVTIENPDLNVRLNVPDVVGRGDFLTEIILENTKQVPAEVNVEIEGETFNVIVDPKAILRLYKTFSILKDKVINALISGDVSKHIEKLARFGEKIDIKADPEELYAEGAIEIPISAANTGELDSIGKITFDLCRADGASIYQKTLAYNLAKVEALKTSLSLELSEGSYSLRYDSFCGSGVKQFRVAKFNRVGLDAVTGQMQSGKIPLAVTAINLGGNDFYGKLKLEALGVLEEIPLELKISEVKTFNLEIKPAGVPPGDYMINIAAEYSGSIAAEKNVTAFIKAAEFELVHAPPAIVLNAGESASLVFTIKNTGGIAGEAVLSLKWLDLADEAKEIWLEPGESQDLTFGLSVPLDFAKGEYILDFLLNDKPRAIPLKVLGIDIRVEACLDKNIYFLGETAKLTIAVTNLNGAITPRMYALMRHEDSEERQDFVLTKDNRLVFDIPINELSQEKIFYGLYWENGKSAYINDIDAPVRREEIALWTDKQTYNPQEEVTIFAESNTAGALKISTVGYEDEAPLDGRTTRAFILPANLAAGTYVIDYNFNDKSYKCFFNLKAEKIKILACRLDRDKYLLQDLIKAVMLIESEKEMNVDLKIWLQPPSYEYKKLIELPYALLKGQNTVQIEANFETKETGIHGFNYGIFKAGTDNLLASGSELFDAGDSALVPLPDEKQIYPDEEAVPPQAPSGGGNTPSNVSIGSSPVTRDSVEASGLTNTELPCQSGADWHKAIAAIRTISLNLLNFAFETVSNGPPAEIKDDYLTPDAWRNTDVRIALKAADDCGGIKAAYYYRIDNLEVKEGDDIVIFAEGIHSVEYWSEDIGGNAVDKRALTVKIDKTPPCIEIISPCEAEYYHDEFVTIDLRISDGLSQFKSACILLDGADAGGLSSLKLDAGRHVLKVSAQDNAGNKAEKTIEFLVKLKAGMKIKPKALDINSRGVFMAKVVFPGEYNVSTITDAECGGAKALKIYFEGRKNEAKLFFGIRDMTKYPTDGLFVLRGHFEDGKIFEARDAVKKIIK